MSTSPLPHPPQATPIATTTSQLLPKAFFARPAELVAPDLIGCLLVKRQADGELLWGVIVETETYSQHDPVTASKDDALLLFKQPSTT